MATINVFTGPSLAPDHVRQFLPTAEVLPPVARGDVYAARERGAGLIVVIDGSFSQQLAVSPREIVEVLGDGAMVRLATNLGTGIGPVLGAALAAVSYDLLFWSEALAVLIFAGVSMVALRNTEAGKATRSAEKTPGSADGSYFTVVRDGRYLLFLLAIFITSMVYMQYIAALPLAVKAHGMPVMVYSVLVGLNGFTVVGCELLVARRVQFWPPALAAATGVALTALGMSMYALPFGLTGFVVATMIWTFGECVGYPTLFYAYPAQAGPKELSGRYLGASNSMYGLGSALGPVVGIMVWNALGSGVWWCCGAAGLLATGISWLGVAPRASQRRQCLSIGEAER